LLDLLSSDERKRNMRHVEKVFARSCFLDASDPMLETAQLWFLSTASSRISSRAAEVLRNCSRIDNDS